MGHTRNRCEVFNMKKGVQIAFAIALVILAIICTAYPEADLMASIVYAVVVPSFILSVISFVAEISDICEAKAGNRAKTARETAELAEEVVQLGMENYRAGIHEVPYVEGRVPTKLIETQEKCAEFYGMASASMDVRTFFVRLKRKCDIIAIGGYVILFLSLSLSPYIARWLSAVNLNCITLWSLALLYITLELKTEICERIFEWLYNRAKKRVDKSVEEHQREQEEV